VRVRPDGGYVPQALTFWRIRMQPTGIIFAALDCDVDSIEEWNRWYDLEHVPPNVSMPGVMLGRRYVAAPQLHESRRTETGSPFADGRAVFLTMYTLCVEPSSAFDDMSTLLPKLYAGDRMRFPADKKTVREGDVLRLEYALGDPAGTLEAEDVPFVGHTAVIVVQRESHESLDAWYATDWAPRVVALEGVHGLVSFSSLNRDGLLLDLVLVEGDAATRLAQLRDAAPLHPDTRVTVEGAWDLIQPLHYPFAEVIRASDLPRTVA
jgi:hypothetical protein